MALKKVRGNFDRLFEKNLADLVRGIRSNKDNEAKYIQQCIEEIKDELKQGNAVVKSNAIAKVTYLQMLGYDMSWAAFNVIEVMSSPRFTHKRIGYLGASQSFHEDTEVLMLATNLIRKDINSHNQYDAEDLSRDLTQDIISLMSSTRPYLRKKAVLMSYKVFLKYPDALRIAFPKLKEKLEDPDPGVQSATVNVICELARHNPKNYITLAPTFFKLMTTSSNNWMLIKIIKLLAALVPLEPRLGKKLIEPLTTLIHSTSAMSLLYECINTVIAVLLTVSAEVPNRNAAVNLCVQKLRILIEDADQNLKYLGLLAMSRILQAHPKSVSAHKDLILTCLDDRDESIRLRALDLLYGMVNKKNLMDIVRKLMDHMQKAEGTHYRDQLLVKVIDVCSQNGYQYVTDFEWYISVLVDLTRIYGTHHGELIASQLLDVAVRVQSIRHFAVQQMALLLENTQLLLSSTVEGKTIQEVLLAAAFICGEYSEHLINPQNCLQSMFYPKVTTLAAHIQIVYVQSIGKLYACALLDAERDDSSLFAATDADSNNNNKSAALFNGSSTRSVSSDDTSNSKVDKINSLMIDKLPMFVQSPDLEVQERACSLVEIVKVIQHLRSEQPALRTAHLVALLFAGELNPVALKAQRKVPLPEGLDLDKWINEPPSDTENDEADVEVDEYEIENLANGASAYRSGTGDFGGRPTTLRTQHPQRQQQPEPTEDELRQIRHQRLAEQAQNPHYLKSSSSALGQAKGQSLNINNVTRRSSNDPSQGPTSSTGLTTASLSGKFDMRQQQRNAAKSASNTANNNNNVTTPLDDIPGLISTDKYLQQQRSTLKPAKGPRKGGKTGSKRAGTAGGAVSDDENQEPTPRHVVNTGAGEEPEGAKSTDEDEQSRRIGGDPYKALDIDLDEVLKSHNEQRRRFQQQDEQYYADVQRREHHAEGFGGAARGTPAKAGAKPAAASEIYVDGDFYRRKPMTSTAGSASRKNKKLSAKQTGASTTTTTLTTDVVAGEQHREKRVKKKSSKEKTVDAEALLAMPAATAVKEKKLKKAKKPVTSEQSGDKTTGIAEEDAVVAPLKKRKKSLKKLSDNIPVLDDAAAADNKIDIATVADTTSRPKKLTTKKPKKLTASLDEKSSEMAVGDSNFEAASKPRKSKQSTDRGAKTEKRSAKLKNDTVASSSSADVVR